MLVFILIITECQGCGYIVYDDLFQISDFIVENPGDVPVLIQILPLPLYPNPQTIIEMLSHR